MFAIVQRDAAVNGVLTRNCVSELEK